jgi:hypothetical protein
MESRGKIDNNGDSNKRLQRAELLSRSVRPTKGANSHGYSVVRDFESGHMPGGP